MNLVKAMSYIQLNTDVEITKKEFAKIVGVTEQALQPYRKDKDKHIPDGWIDSLINKFGNIFPADITAEETSNKYIIVPYWKCANKDINEKIRNKNHTERLLDLQFVLENNLKPENLVIIAMIGDDMDGGFYPMKNKDILLVDTSRNSVYESGVYFCTSHGNSRVYVRRIIEKMTDGIHCVTTVDNLNYKPLIEKKWTIEDWIAADIQVIGRVIKNLSYVT